MKTIFLPLILLITISQLFSQIRLEIDGDAKIEGLLQLAATSVDSSIFIGFNAGKNDDGTFKENIFIGNNAGERNTSGADNVFVGATAGKLNQTGTFNTFIGGNAGSFNRTGSNNVFVGYVAGFTNTTGGQNTYIGRFAGQNTSANTFCTFLGYNAGHPDISTNFSNSMALGSNARITASNYIAIGNTSITSIKGQVNFTTFSDGRFKRKIKEDIPGLDFILKLRPVTYQVEKNKVAKFLGESERNKSESRNDSQESVRYSGFIAQEVEKVANKINYDFSGVDKPKNEKSLYGIRYAEFVVPLVQGMQEQQKIIQTLEYELEKNRIKTEDLETELKALNALVNQLILEEPKDDKFSSPKSAKLEQNEPNPFKGTTTIPYFLPQKINNARIRIYDISGVIVEEIELRENGEGEIEVHTDKFSKGIYHYSLEIDGQIIDTKKMSSIK